MNEATNVKVSFPPTEAIATAVHDAGKPYGGQIEQWYFGFGQSVYGFLYGDPMQRWEDGTPIHTSYIVGIKENQTILETRNTIYLLGTKRDKV